MTGVDVSEVALERAAIAGRDAGVTVQWVCADVSAMPSAPGGYDLVSVLYPALKHSPGDEAICGLLDAVAPGGTLLVVGHAPIDPDYARAHGFEIADYVQIADLRARLNEGWEVQVDETRPRVDPCLKVRRTRMTWCFARSDAGKPAPRRWVRPTASMRAID